MATATAMGMPIPYNGKGHAVRPAQPQQFHSNSADDDTPTALRLQRLKLLGIIGARANMLAPMVWGEAA